MFRRSFARRDYFPHPRAAVHLDFIRRRYWWLNKSRQESEFTGFTLNGSTFDEHGLTPSTTIAITLALSGIWTLPGAFTAQLWLTANPGTQRGIFSIDDGTDNERVTPSQGTAAAQLLHTVVDGGSGTISIAINGNLLEVVGFAGSFQTNEGFAARNGIQGTADVSATMPTVTTLRIGKRVAASSEFTGAISHIVVFDDVKTQGEVNEHSIASRWAV